MQPTVRNIRSRIEDLLGVAVAASVYEVQDTRMSAAQEYLAEVDRGGLSFCCIFCNDPWDPTPGEEKRLRADMEKGWVLLCETARDRR